MPSISLKEEESLVFNWCPHQEKYSFHSESRLKQYLENCKGWVSDPNQKYTVNYILMVLFTDLKQKNYILQDAYVSGAYFICCDQQLQSALQAPKPFLPIQEVRGRVLQHLQHNEPNPKHGSYAIKLRVPFWCTRGFEPWIADLFDNYHQNSSVIFSRHCRPDVRFKWDFFRPPFGR